MVTKIDSFLESIGLFAILKQTFVIFGHKVIILFWIITILFVILQHNFMIKGHKVQDVQNSQFCDKVVILCQIRDIAKCTTKYHDYGPMLQLD